MNARYTRVKGEAIKGEQRREREREARGREQTAREMRDVSVTVSIGRQDLCPV